MNRPRTAAPPHRLLIVLDALGSGGGERVMLRLAGAFAGAGCAVHIAARQVHGASAGHVPAGVEVSALAAHPGVRALRWRTALPAPWARRALLFGNVADSTLRLIPGLRRVLDTWQPDAVLGTGVLSNLLAAWAAGQAAGRRVVLSEHVSVRAYLADHQARAGAARAARARRRVRALPGLLRGTYPQADALVAVSNGVADELAGLTGMARAAIHVIANPVVDAALLARAAQAPDHPWFAPGEPPPLLAIGRLVPQKDYPTLVRALALLEGFPDLRLVILGEGSEHAALRALAEELGVGARVSLAGFVDNPFAYLARARVLVLSSRFEGLPLSLIEALACGCPVVSTDCPHGPAEILDGGRYGALVPMADPAALAAAIARTLHQPPDPAAGRARAQAYTVQASARAYGERLWPGRNPFGPPPQATPPPQAPQAP